MGKVEASYPQKPIKWVVFFTLHFTVPTKCESKRKIHFSVNFHNENFIMTNTNLFPHEVQSFPLVISGIHVRSSRNYDHYDVTQRAITA